MNVGVLVLNAGSSSVKFSRFDITTGKPPRLTLKGEVEGLPDHARLKAEDANGRPLVDRAVEAKDPESAFDEIAEWLGEGHPFDIVGHRIVHGGQRFATPVFIDEGTLEALQALVPLAPLHQPHNIAVVRAVLKRTPKARQVACFDTAFHATQPDVATRFALPPALHDKGIRRYGFHGLSYEYIASVLCEIAPAEATGKIVVAHLGSGASLCALDRGRSIATTMSFTPLDGLPMGTRCGSLDPGVVLYLQKHERQSADAIEHLLYEKSGLLGVSGISSDMRLLLASDTPRAQTAVELFTYRIGREIGSLVAALGGLDGLIFTGGIGEKAAAIRARVCEQARWLGLTLDATANDRHADLISAAGSRIPVRVVPTDENLMIARHIRHLLQPSNEGKL